MGGVGGSLGEGASGRGMWVVVSDALGASPLVLLEVERLEGRRSANARSVGNELSGVADP